MVFGPLALIFLANALKLFLESADNRYEPEAMYTVPTFFICALGCGFVVTDCELPGVGIGFGITTVAVESGKIDTPDFSSESRYLICASWRPASRSNVAFSISCFHKVEAAVKAARYFAEIRSSSSGLFAAAISALFSSSILKNSLSFLA
jgi:hypothetical protein